jgi:hypothetical protein
VAAGAVDESALAERGDKETRAAMPSAMAEVRAILWVIATSLRLIVTWAQRALPLYNVCADRAVPPDTASSGEGGRAEIGESLAVALVRRGKHANEPHASPALTRIAFASLLRRFKALIRRLFGDDPDPKHETHLMRWAGSRQSRGKMEPVARAIVPEILIRDALRSCRSRLAARVPQSIIHVLPPADGLQFYGPRSLPQQCNSVGVFALMGCWGDWAI